MERKKLIEKLKQEHRFWSYDVSSIIDVPDEILIELTLLYLGAPERDVLFRLLPYKKIKEVWLERMVPQGEYLYRINCFLARTYFHAKKPEQYVKSMCTRIINRRLRAYENDYDEWL